MFPIVSTCSECSQCGSRSGKAIGMPTTLLIDPNGCEIASLSGPAEWASDDGVKLVSAALGR
jgi:hypothetical protein